MHLLDMIEACKANKQPLVLKHLIEAQSFVIDDFKDPKPFELSKETELDLPFKTCAFEMLEYGLSFYVKIPQPNGTAREVDMLCIVAEEIEPKKIIFYVYGDFGRGLELKWIHPDDEGRDFWFIVRHKVQECLQYLKDGQHGTSSHRPVVKWKDRHGEKQQSKLKRVIHIRPRNSVGESVNQKQSVQWSHAFWVMGHWREHHGIGKDRDGNYTVKGKTWVIPHVRNADIGDPIAKIRVVRVAHNKA